VDFSFSLSPPQCPTDVAWYGSVIDAFIEKLNSPTVVPRLEAFVSALRLYAGGLRVYAQDPTSAFIAFVDCIETLTAAMAQDFTEEDLRDDEMEKEFTAIRTGLREAPEEAERIIAVIRKRLLQFQVSRKFRLAFTKSIDEGFFQRHDVNVEGPVQFGDLKKAVDKIYNLRSSHLHTGKSIDLSVECHGHILYESGPGLVDIVHIRKKPYNGPSILFLERSARYILLRLLSRHIVAFPADANAPLLPQAHSGATVGARS
jgi:hypothetical protein